MGTYPPILPPFCFQCVTVQSRQFQEMRTFQIQVKSIVLGTKSHLNVTKVTTRKEWPPRCAFLENGPCCLSNVLVSNLPGGGGVTFTPSALCGRLGPYKITIFRATSSKQLHPDTYAPCAELVCITYATFTDTEKVHFSCDKKSTE